MILAILVSSGLLLLGLVLRAKLRIVQWSFIPASVLGGLIGLIIFQIALRIPSWSARAGEISSELSSWPGLLIAIVFAGLLLERPGRSFAGSARSTAQAAIYAWIIIVGEIALGLFATWMFILPNFDVPAAFGQLIEAGFAGGHGTAAALGAVYENVLEFPAGRDLGFVMATIGLIYSVISGILFVNIAVRRGMTRSGDIEFQLTNGLGPRRDPQPVALGHTQPDVLDPFAFQLCIVAIAFALGMFFQWGFIQLAGVVLDDESMRYVGNVPLFLFTLIGGWATRRLFMLFGIGDLIDTQSVKRIVAIAMEFLIVAAIASLRIEVVATFLSPIVILCAVGFVWTGICLFLIARRILPRQYWFELGVINYGMSTGTTAQGMMLLRIVDPDLESGAAEDYAFAAPFSAPFVGGGALTLALPLILTKVATPIVFSLMFIVIAGLLIVGLWLRQVERGRP